MCPPTAHSGTNFSRLLARVRLTSLFLFFNVFFFVCFFYAAAAGLYFNPDLTGCGSVNTDAAKDKIVIVNRGACKFTEKVGSLFLQANTSSHVCVGQSHNAQAAGAVGIIVINTDNSRVLMQAPDAETNTLHAFPAVIVTLNDGAKIRAAGSGAAVRLCVVLDFFCHKFYF
jgi:hypothetical protein